MEPGAIRVGLSAMKFFIDTADPAEIEPWAETGLLDGVTTNPSLIAKTGRKIKSVIEEIRTLVAGPISVEVTATERAQMIEEGRALAAIVPGLAVKLPLTRDGIAACKALSGEGIAVNMTLCFSAPQAILAAKAGAAFVSPFVGRLDDLGAGGMELIDDICQIYDQYEDFTTQVLVASVRHPMHVVEAGRLGAHIVTLPPKLLNQMFNHPLTDKGLAAFLADWAETGQSILET